LVVLLVEAVDEPFEGVRNVDLEQAEAIGVSLKGITISDTSSKGGAVNWMLHQMRDFPLKIFSYFFTMFI
jgi:hypothetical protein|tara:strand:- start:1999 stop:2208 length:210 start_codon:yes stop_codon:yes gene_type:complete